MQAPMDQAQAQMMAMYQQMLQAQMMQAMAAQAAQAGQVPGMAGQLVAAAPAAVPAIAAAPAVAGPGARTGVCKMWNDEKKFGFLSADDGGEDLFCHKSSLVGLADGVEGLTKGDTVRFDSTYDEAKGKQRASNVTVTGHTDEMPGGGKSFGKGEGGGKGGSGQKKRVLCTFFESGGCSRGSACTFAHGAEEIGTFADPNAVADGGSISAGDWICPACGDNQFARNPVCRKCGAPKPAKGAGGDGGGGSWSGGGSWDGSGGNWAASGWQEPAAAGWQDPAVAAGEPTMTCSFHGLERDVMSLENDGAGGIKCKADSPCQVGAQGSKGASKGGAGGGKAAGGWQKKTRLCTYFEQGTCQKGEACSFAHGEAQMGTFFSADGETAPAKGGGKSAFSPGDWNCSQCGDHQFARNTECRKCGAPNPTGASAAPARVSPY